MVKIECKEDSKLYWNDLLIENQSLISNPVEGVTYEVEGEFEKVYCSCRMGQSLCFVSCGKEVVARLLPEKPENSSHSYSEGSETETCPTCHQPKTMSGSFCSNSFHILSVPAAPLVDHKEECEHLKECLNKPPKECACYNEDLFRFPAIVSDNELRANWTGKVPTVDGKSQFHYGWRKCLEWVQRNYALARSTKGDTIIPKAVPVVDHNQQGKGMDVLKIYRFQAVNIEDTFRLAARTLESHGRETSMDRDIMQSWQTIKNVLSGDIDKHVERQPINPEVIAVDKESQEGNDIPVMSSVAEFSLESQEDMIIEIGTILMTNYDQGKTMPNTIEEIKSKFELTRKPKE